MPSETFNADRVGICVSTLHVTPSHFLPEDVDRLCRVAASAGFPSVALQSYWVTRCGVDATRKLLDETGMTAGALEGAILWADGRDAGEQGCRPTARDDGGNRRWGAPRHFDGVGARIPTSGHRGICHVVRAGQGLRHSGEC